MRFEGYIFELLPLQPNFDDYLSKIKYEVELENNSVDKPSKNDIEFRVGKNIYYLNNNSNKFERAKQEAGKDATDEQILAYYNKLGGYIQDYKLDKVDGNKFWLKEKAILERRERVSQNQKKIWEFFKHPVVAFVTSSFILYLIYLVFKVNLSQFN